MSDLRVTNLSGRTAGTPPNLPEGAISAGVVTATGFSGSLVGNVIGNVTGTASSSTVSADLIGSPDITVSSIIANKIEPQDARFRGVSEFVNRQNGNTVGLVYQTGGSNIGFTTTPTGDITLNVNQIPITSDFDDHSLTFSVIVSNTGTARSVTSVNLNGLSKTIKWAGGSLASAITGVTTTNGTDIYNFTGINTVGSATTTANYIVLGSVNGGYA